MTKYGDYVKCNNSDCPVKNACMRYDPGSIYAVKIKMKGKSCDGYIDKWSKK